MIKFEHPLLKLINIAEKYIETDVEIWFSQLDNDQLGSTLFPDDKELPVQIVLDYRLGVIQSLDILAHELAHVIAGANAEHGEKWEKVYNNLNEEYCKTFKEKNVDVIEEIYPQECKHCFESVKICNLCGLIDEST